MPAGPAPHRGRDFTLGNACQGPAFSPKPRPRRTAGQSALSSVVEHILHTDGVAGSKPAARTIPNRGKSLIFRCLSVDYREANAGPDLPPMTMKCTGMHVFADSIARFVARHPTAKSLHNSGITGAPSPPSGGLAGVNYPRGSRIRPEPSSFSDPRGATNRTATLTPNRPVALS